MKSLTAPTMFHLGGETFYFKDLIAEGYKCDDENRLTANKKGACIKAVYSEEDNKMPEIKLTDREMFYFMGNRWMTVVVNEKLNSVDCVRFIKI